jgi:hypothetical protein
MNLNQSFLLIQMSVHGCFYTALCFFLLQILLNNVTMHNEGVYIPFPSCALQLSSLELNSILYINYFKCRLPTKEESYPLKVHLQYTSAPHLNGSFKICATIPNCFQNLCWLVQLSSTSALARLMCWRCSCITLRDELKDIIIVQKVLRSLPMRYDAKLSNL